MKKITAILILPLLLIGFVLIISDSCSNDDSSAPVSTSGIIFNPDLIYGTVIDVNGNVYKTITIGTQTWMAENLRATKYRNGDLIPKVTDYPQWEGLKTGAYCDYNNLLGSSTTYGRLYNWHAVIDSRIIAPKGWHIPTDAEWTTLTNYLGGDSVACSKLKEKGTKHWPSNPYADNLSGFTALPAGYRNYDGTFDGIGASSFWWSSSESTSIAAFYRNLYYNTNLIVRDSVFKENGYSIRCIKD